MKKRNSILAGLLFLSQMMYGQCPTNNFLSFADQAEIDNFPSQYPNCHHVPGSFYITGNINNLQGLLGIKKIDGSLYIRDNNVITNLDGLDSLESIGGDFLIEANPILEDLLALNNLKTIGLDPNATWDGFFAINVNNNLINLAGLEHLEHIEGGLFIQQNDNLESLNALNALNSIGNAGLFIVNNKVTSLSGIDNIDYTTIDTLVLKNCSTLETCDVSSICNFLENGGKSYIGNNLTPCNSKPEVLLSCRTSSVSQDGNKSQFVSLFPNPTADCLNIHFNDPEVKLIKIQDITGKTVFEKMETNDDTEICFEGSGIFILQIYHSDRIYSERIIKTRK